MTHLQCFGLGVAVTLLVVSLVFPKKGAE
jgi:hypothetical protein